MQQSLFDPAAQELSTAEISDALDYFHLPGSALGIGRVAGRPRVFGAAYTVRFAPVDTAVIGTVGDYIDEVPAGSVIVLDNGGRPDCTVWGGILSRLGNQRGIAGTVIDGVCRDTVEADGCGYPLYACGRFMRTGKDRVQVEQVQGPVTLGGVRVRPGDIVAGDEDGIVVVPREHAREVFDKALATRRTEHAILQDALAGMPLAEARRKHGYHTLQRGQA